MAHGFKTPGDKTVLVVDWGGGTLDVTLLESMDQVFHEQSSSGVIECGGLDFDRILFNKLRAASTGVESWSPADVGALKIECEKAKIKLSSAEETNVAMPGGEYRHVTRRIFDDETRALVDRVRAPIERTLADGKRQPSDIDTLLLVGGTCKIPAVRQFICELLNMDPAPNVDPMTAIAEGAAIAAAIMNGELETTDFLVSTEHSLGTAVLGRVPGTLEFSEIIPRNHKLPAKQTETYVPASDFQEVLRVDILEGDPAAGMDDPDVIELRSWDIPIPPRPRSEASFDLTYEYNLDGIVYVRLVDNVTGQVVHAGEVSAGVTQDKRQLVEIAERVGQTIESHEVQRTEVASTTRDPQDLLLLQQARQKVMPFLDDAQSSRVGSLVAALEAASSESDIADAREELAAELRKYSYLL
jgi:molecular chaperone DnaK (HSP70)